MIYFFFYNKLTCIELIKKINNDFEIYDGYILIQNYDIINNHLEISNTINNNNKLLYGKIVNFKMSLNDVLKKINEMVECRSENKVIYTIETVWANKTIGGTYKSYIIY